MPDYSFNDPKHWRKRAEESRARAEQMPDGDAKQMMFGNAERAEERLAKQPPQSN